MGNGWLAVAGVTGLTAVAAGAFGAHALKSRLEPSDLAAFEVGVRYQMYHALALLVVAFLRGQRPSAAMSTAAWCMLIGIVLFSGSLHGLSLLKWKWLGPVTPIGGLFMMIGWAALMVAGIRKGG